MIVSRKLQDNLSVGPTAVALGMFDGLHLGHQHVIRQVVRAAGEEGLTPCVFTFTTSSGQPDAKTHNRRLSSYRLREQLLEEMGVGVMLRPDFAAIRGLSAEEFVRGILVEKLDARFVSCGVNFRFGKGAAGDAAALEQLCGPLGVRVAANPLVEMDGELISSTRIRRCIAAGEIPLANRLLGRSFTIDFEVVYGRQLGRTLDSPTINQPFPHDFVVPRYGVYATVTWVDGRCYPSVTNVGTKPTVGSDAVLSETYIHSYSGDLYGRRIAVEFLEFVRPERKFTSIEELKAQIWHDASVTEATGRKYILERTGPDAQWPAPLRTTGNKTTITGTE